MVGVIFTGVLMPILNLQLTGGFTKSQYCLLINLIESNLLHKYPASEEKAKLLPAWYDNANRSAVFLYQHPRRIIATYYGTRGIQLPSTWQLPIDLVL
jgi:hypothetical protein